jgi:hypothetical protein
MVAHAAGIIAHRRCGKSLSGKFDVARFSSYHTLTSSLTELLSIEPPHFSAKHRAPMDEVKYDPRSAEIQLRQSPPPAFFAKRGKSGVQRATAALERHTQPSALRETSISLMWQRDTKTVSLLMWPYSVCHSPHPRQWKIYRSGSPPNRCVLRTNFIGWAQPRQRGGLGGLGLDLSAHSSHMTRCSLGSRK